MKSSSKVAIRLLLSLLVLSMAGLIVVQHERVAQVQAKERALQHQVDALNAQVSQLMGEEARLLKLIKAQQAGADTSQGPDQFTELLKLRGEVGRLLLENRDAQQWRRADMQAAAARLPNAEAELAQASQMVSNNTISEGELSRARFAVELLKAEAAGDKARAAQVRLRQAEYELARVTQLRANNIVSEQEFAKAQFAVDLLKAEASGDEPQAARLRLSQAQYELDRATELRKRMLISEAEYDAAARKVDSYRNGAK